MTASDPERAGPLATAPTNPSTPTPSLRRRATLATLGLFAMLLLVIGAAVDSALWAQLNRELDTRLADRADRAVDFTNVGYGPDQLPGLLGGRDIRVLVTAADGTSYGDAGLAVIEDTGPVTATPSTSASSPAPTVAPTSAATAPEPRRPGPRHGPAGRPGPGPGGGPGPAGPGPGPDPTAEPAAAEPPQPAPTTEPALPAPPAESSTTRVVDLPNGARVQLVADTDPITDVRNDLRMIMALAGLGTLALATLALLVAVSRALRPLDRLTGVARQITAGDRGRRLRPDRANTELGRAGVAFDEMLDDLEVTESRARRSADDATVAAATARAAEARTRGFLSDAAHELRTPLAGIQVAAEQLTSGTDTTADARQQRRASLLLGETRRAARLVGDMLDMARIEAGQSLQLQAVDLGRIARAEVERAAMLAPQLTVERTGLDGPTVTADPTRLAQILSNLLDNARRHTPPGGTITVDLASGADGGVEATVTDTGPGILDADRERIFERLVRLADARDRDSGGAGLGLAIARGLARAHGGDLTCPPHEGGGRFRLTLPASGPDEQGP